MAQEVIIKLENALLDSLNEIDKLYARKIQGDMHRCAAKCCDSVNDPVMKVHNCIKQCSTTFEKVHHYLEAEFNQFQGSLQKCVLQCGNDSVDSLSPSSRRNNNIKSPKYETCIMSCANKQIGLVPRFLDHVKDGLSKKAYLNFPLDDDPKAFQEPHLL